MTAPIGPTVAGSGRCSGAVSPASSSGQCLLAPLPTASSFLTWSTTSSPALCSPPRTPTKSLLRSNVHSRRALLSRNASTEDTRRRHERLVSTSDCATQVPKVDATRTLRNRRYGTQWSRAIPRNRAWPHPGGRGGPGSVGFVEDEQGEGAQLRVAVAQGVARSLGTHPRVASTS